MEEMIKENENNKAGVPRTEVWEKRTQERGSNTELEIRGRVRTAGIKGEKMSNLKSPQKDKYRKTELEVVT